MIYSPAEFQIATSNKESGLELFQIKDHQNLSTQTYFPFALFSEMAQMFWLEFTPCLPLHAFQQ